MPCSIQRYYTSVFRVLKQFGPFWSRSQKPGFYLQKVFGLRYTFGRKELDNFKLELVDSSSKNEWTVLLQGTGKQYIRTAPIKITQATWHFIYFKTALIILHFQFSSIILKRTQDSYLKEDIFISKIWYLINYIYK